MTIGNVKGAASVYQGSGQESSSVKPKSAPETRVSQDKVLITEPKQTQQNEKRASSDTRQEGNTAKQNDSIRRAVEQINKKTNNSEAVFGIHEETNRVTIKIVDKQTKEIIKEFPPEETLDMIAKAWELAGLMVDEKR